jgi:hypothetical protein
MVQKESMPAGYELRCLIFAVVVIVSPELSIFGSITLKQEEISNESR